MLKALYYASSREAETLALTFNIPGHIRIVLRYANQPLFLDDQTIIMTYSFAKDTPIPVLKALALSEDLKEVRILKEAYHLDIDTEIEDINTDQEMRFVSVLKCEVIFKWVCSFVGVTTIIKNLYLKDFTMLWMLRMIESIKPPKTSQSIGCRRHLDNLGCIKLQLSQLPTMMMSWRRGR
jgi:hypothetical protein